MSCGWAQQSPQIDNGKQKGSTCMFFRDTKEDPCDMIPGAELKICPCPACPCPPQPQGNNQQCRQESANNQRCCNGNARPKTSCMFFRTAKEDPCDMIPGEEMPICPMPVCPCPPQNQGDNQQCRQASASNQRCCNNSGQQKPSCMFFRTAKEDACDMIPGAEMPICPMPVCPCPPQNQGDNQACRQASAGNNQQCCNSNSQQKSQTCMFFRTAKEDPCDMIPGAELKICPCPACPSPQQNEGNNQQCRQASARNQRCCNNNAQQKTSCMFFRTAKDDPCDMIPGAEMPICPMPVCPCPPQNQGNNQSCRPASSRNQICCNNTQQKSSTCMFFRDSKEDPCDMIPGAEMPICPMPVCPCPPQNQSNNQSCQQGNGQNQGMCCNTNGSDVRIPNPGVYFGRCLSARPAQSQQANNTSNCCPPLRTYWPTPTSRPAQSCGVGRSQSQQSNTSSNCCPPPRPCCPMPCRTPQPCYPGRCLSAGPCRWVHSNSASDCCQQRLSCCPTPYQPPQNCWAPCREPCCVPSYRF